MPRVDAFLEIGRQQGASDIHFTVGLPPLVRMDDDLTPVQYRALTDQECQDLVREIMDVDQWAKLGQVGAVDIGYSADGLGRFRLTTSMPSTGSIARTSTAAGNPSCSVTTLKQWCMP